MANSAINLTSLDFDSLKKSLKTYLQSQSVFKDYDFSGSNMNVLLDVLSYNTYLNSFYLNMAISESFLDTAQLRDSVISHAKELNYLPSSYKSSEALVNVSIAYSGTSNIFEIPKGTQFSGLNSNGSFIFTTDRNYVAVSSNNTFNFSNVAIYEGTYVSESFYVNYAIETQKFILSNPQIDIDSLTITVLNNSLSNSATYSYVDHLFDLTPNSQVYFLQAAPSNTYEVIFGDDVFGMKPINGSTVLANYRVSAGTNAGGINTFYLDQDLGPINSGHADATVTTTSPSSIGANTEAIESIRFRAPRAYQTQDRAVTNNDYKNLIIDNFNEIEDVSVYGGETLAGEVQYGKVFIAPSTFSGAPLTAQRKVDLLTFLNTKKVIGITPVLIDPDYLYVIANITVNVSFKDTALSPADITTAVTTAVTNFNNSYLERFNNSFKFSKFTEAVDAADPSISSNIITTQIYKIANPTLGMTQPITVNFNNRILPGTIYSTSFILDDGNSYQLVDYNPNVNSFTRSEDPINFSVINTNPIVYLKQVTVNNTQNYITAGSVDYQTGIMTIKNLKVIDFLNSSGIVTTATPYGDDIYGTYNDIVQLDIGSLNISVVSV